jgi:oxygen-independent coproporphyrinogen-3 oxidase
MTVHNIGRYATVTVPRYTSYPTAPHFLERCGCQLYARWLGETPASEHAFALFSRALLPLDLRLLRLLYQGKPQGRADPGLWPDNGAGGLPGGRPPASKLPVTHMHWGGGTPSLMPAQGFAAIFKAH